MQKEKRAKTTLKWRNNWTAFICAGVATVCPAHDSLGELWVQPPSLNRKLHFMVTANVPRGFNYRIDSIIIKESTLLDLKVFPAKTRMIHFSPWFHPKLTRWHSGSRLSYALYNKTSLSNIRWETVGQNPVKFVSLLWKNFPNPWNKRWIAFTNGQHLDFVLHLNPTHKTIWQRFHSVTFIRSYDQVQRDKKPRRATPRLYFTVRRLDKEPEGIGATGSLAERTSSK